MRWTRGDRRSDIEDRRGEGGGGFGGLRGGGGIGGAVILRGLSLVFGQNFFALLGDGDVTPGPGGGSPSAPPRKVSPAEEEIAAFVSFVLDDAQNTWTREVPQIG